jgi:hypothetical protein
MQHLKSDDTPLTHRCLSTWANPGVQIRKQNKNRVNSEAIRLFFQPHNRSQLKHSWRNQTINEIMSNFLVPKERARWMHWPSVATIQSGIIISIVPLRDVSRAQSWLDFQRSLQKRASSTNLLYLSELTHNQIVLRILCVVWIVPWSCSYPLDQHENITNTGNKWKDAWLYVIF